MQMTHQCYSFPLFWFEIIAYSTPYMTGRATTLGVFKAYVVFLLLMQVIYKEVARRPPVLQGETEPPVGVAFRLQSRCK